MRITFLLLLSLASSIAYGSSSFVLGYSSYATPSNMIRDPAGNIYTFTFNVSGPFSIARLDPFGKQTLFQTTLGSAGDRLTAVTVDGSGNLYMAGFSKSGTFPTTPNAFQAPHQPGQSTIFAAKYDTIGGRLVYSALISAAVSANTSVNSIAVDASGNLILGGNSGGSGWPTTAGALQTTTAITATASSNGPGFITKLNSTGSVLVFSTYIGGDTGSGGYTIVDAVTFDPTGAVYASGITGVATFPTTAGAFQTTQGAGGGCFVSKLAANASSLVYSTFLSGTDPNNSTACDAIVADGTGSVYVAGATSDKTFPVTSGAFQTQFQGLGCHTSVSGCLFNLRLSPNIFISKINPTGTALTASTFLGGNGGIDGGDTFAAFAIDSTGNAYVTGSTTSGNFPTANPIASNYDCSLCVSLYLPSDMFVSVLDPTLSTLSFSTFLGGANADSAQSMSLDGAGGIWLGGTSQGGFPVTPDAAQPGPILPQFAGQAPSATGVLVHLIPAASTAAPVSLTSSNPSVVNEGTVLASVSLIGTNFTPDCIALIDGVVRATTFVSSTQLTVAVNSNDFPPNKAARFINVQRRTPEGYIASVSTTLLLGIAAPSLNGQVDIDVHDMNGNPVTGAKVNLVGATYNIANGSLIIRFNPNGTLVNTLTVTAPGYQTATVSVSVFGGQETSVSIVLVPQGTGQTATFQAGLTLDTGINLTAGQTLIIYAQGNWSGYGPDGQLGCASAAGSKLPNGGRCLALAAQIGTSPWFYAGSAFAGPVATSGRLYLGVNDLETMGRTPFNVTVIVLSNAICTAEPSINMSLDPGFYITEVRNAAGTRAGYWGVGVNTLEASGGFNFGGVLEEDAGNPAFGAVYLGVADTIHVNVGAQTLTSNLGLVPGFTVQVLDSNHNPVNAAQTGTTAVAFDIALMPGFYIVQVQTTPGTQRLTYQAELNNTNGFSGGVNTGGFLPPGSVGFAAFYIPATQSTNIVTYALPTYTNVGASCLTLRLLDANRNVIKTAP
jgi:hypothetical protein